VPQVVESQIGAAHRRARGVWDDCASDSAGPYGR
jgi:hypothetical protein